MNPTVADGDGRVISAEGRAEKQRHSPAWLVLAAVACVLAAMLALADTAYACEDEGPCASPQEQVLCPFAPAGSTGAGGATFDVPKDARNLRYTITDATTGAVYGPANPICGGTTMSVDAALTPGAVEDVYSVDYTLTSTGSSNPGEQHQVIVTADWDRESDIGVTKTLRGGGDTLDAEEATTFVIAIRNYGPAPFEGTLPEEQTKKQGACKWVKNSKGKLGGREPAAGVCDTPIWLQAKGSRRWSLKLKEDLPRGRYVLYSRAISSVGVSECSFTGKDGNRKAFRVQ